MFHNTGETYDSRNIPNDGYYVATIKSIYFDRNNQKRIDVDNLKFLSDSPVGLADIEPHLYFSYQIENFLERKVKARPEILMLMMLLESSVSRPITVVPESYKLFARIIEDYNSQAWGDMWENIFNLQVMHYLTTRYSFIQELQILLMDSYDDLEFNYEAFITDTLGDILPTEESMKELDDAISRILYTNNEEDAESLDDVLGEYLC
jgi:hypothetical protein